MATIPALTKDAIASDNPDTGTGEHDPALIDLTIGETVTYELVLTLPEIPLDGVVLTDTLPDGLQFVSAQVTSVGTGIVASAPSVTNAGQTVTLDFGAVVNPFDGSVGADDEIRVELQAIVTDVAAATDGAVLTNTSALTITPEGEDPLETQTDTADVEVVEPNLTLEKDGTVAANPGDTVTYTVTMVNDGTGPAYDILVQDLLGDPNLSFEAVTVATIDGADILGGLTITPTATGFETLVPAVLPGETLVITYDVTLSAAAPDANTFPNTANIDYDTVPDGDPASPSGRVYNNTDDFSVATVPFLVKTATDSNHGETGSGQGSPDNLDLTVGEEVTYTFEIYLPEILLDSVVMVDTLPPGFEFVSAGLVSVGAGITGASAPVITSAGQTVTFDFGVVDNPFDGTIGSDDVITVEVTSRVLDDALNVDGAVRTNSATLNVDPNGADPFIEVVATEEVDIVEPELTIDKTGPLAVNPGDAATYTVTIVNTGTGPAYDALIQDTFGDPNLSLVPGSVSLTLEGAPITPTVTETGTGFEVIVPTIDLGEVVVVTYQGLLDPNAAPAESYPNSATVDFDTVPDGDPNTTGGRGDTVTD
ncbi:MAG: isopeptide-forming domain-containing fimbrial protein, partial [Planctomycetota bacterium]